VAVPDRVGLWAMPGSHPGSGPLSHHGDVHQGGSYRPFDFPPVLPHPPQPPPGPPGPQAGLGDLASWASTGLVDPQFIEKEAERKKVEIERNLENQLNELDLQWQHERSALQQAADLAKRNAEAQIQEAEKIHKELLYSNAERREREIEEGMNIEKGRLGNEAYAAIRRLTVREKDRISKEAARNAEENFQKAQMYLRDQTFNSNEQIKSEALSKIHELEQAARTALNLAYLPPEVQVPPDITGIPAADAVEAAFAKVTPMTSFAAGAVVPTKNEHDPYARAPPPPGTAASGSARSNPRQADPYSFRPPELPGVMHSMTPGAPSYGGHFPNHPIHRTDSGGAPGYAQLEPMQHWERSEGLAPCDIGAPRSTDRASDAGSRKSGSHASRASQNRRGRHANAV